MQKEMFNLFFCETNKGKKYEKLTNTKALYSQIMFMPKKPANYYRLLSIIYNQQD